VAKNRRSNRLDVDDVLEGRARPNARELIALIHEVNPSGQELPARETVRRYALKNRLQSLLVNRFADELLVEPTDEEGMIGLRHRASGLDARIRHDRPDAGQSGARRRRGAAAARR